MSLRDQFSITNITRIRSQNRKGSKGSVRDLCRADLLKNIGKTVSCAMSLSMLNPPLFQNGQNEQAFAKVNDIFMKVNM